MERLTCSPHELELAVELAFFEERGWRRSSTSVRTYYRDTTHADPTWWCVERLPGGWVMSGGGGNLRLHTSPEFDSYEAAYVYAEIGSWRN